ncbi:metal-sensitive transcriptional regulator [Candidatus Uhrbacteria bacterium]|nr:metal-sensitive transcriptional regulator [Candidatus Uhrbacteria bacterium]
MYIPKTPKERITHRLKISRGHIGKTIRMIEEGAYCIDVIHQLQAVQKALKQAGNILMENHLKTCAATAIRKGRGAKAIAEIMAILNKS